MPLTRKTRALPYLELKKPEVSIGVLLSMLTEIMAQAKSFLKCRTNINDKRAKIQTADFAAGLLQALATSKNRFTLAELNLSVCNFLGKALLPSSFNSRIQSKALTQCLRLLVMFLISKIASLKNGQSDHDKILEAVGVKQILGIDASMISLWDGLSEVFGGTFMTASIKLHFCIDLLSGTIEWFKTTEGKTHDSKCFPRIKQKKLYIFDLGYWSIELLNEISKKKAFFVSRVKSNAKILVQECTYGLGSSLIGKDLLKEAFKKKRKNIVELTGLLLVGKKKQSMRIIGFWHKEEKQYRWYATNLTCSRTLIYQLYRLRWQIELSFKSMKSSLSLDNMPTLNEQAVQNLVLLNLTNYLFSIVVKLEGEELLGQQPDEKARMASLQRTSKLYASVASNLLKIIAPALACSKAEIAAIKGSVNRLKMNLFDPNYKRRSVSVVTLADLL